MEEVDEYGVPIKKQPEVDEYGVPVKKKEQSQKLSTSGGLAPSQSQLSGGQEPPKTISFGFVSPAIQAAVDNVVETLPVKNEEPIRAGMQLISEIKKNNPEDADRIAKIRAMANVAVSKNKSENIANALSGVRYNLEKSAKELDGLTSNLQVDEYGRYILQTQQDADLFNTLSGEVKTLLDQYNVGLSELNASLRSLDSASDMYASVLAATSLLEKQKKEEQGSVLGAGWNELLGGLSRTMSVIEREAVSFTPTPKEGRGAFEQSLDVSMEENRKKLRKDILDAVGSNTTDEYINKMKETFLGGVYLGVAESLPAMAASPLDKGFSMFAQAMSHANETIETNPDLKNLPPESKQVYKLGYTSVMGALERLGFSNLIKNKTISGYITNRVLNKAISTGSLEGVEESLKKTIDAETRSAALDVLKAVGKSALAEGETGGLQEIGDIELQRLVNNLSGKEYFEVPNSLVDYVSQVGLSAAQEAVGGMLMGSVIHGVDGISGKTKASPKEIETSLGYLLEENSLKNISDYVDAKVEAGAMSQTRADEIKNAASDVESIVKTIPEDVDYKTKKEVFDLIKQRKSLEESLNRVDDAYKPELKTKIEEINDKIVSKTQEGYAVQEQGAAEVPVRETPGDSKKVEEGEPRAEPQEITPESATEEEIVTGQVTEQPTGQVEEEISVESVAQKGQQGIELTQEEQTFYAENQPEVDARVQELSVTPEVVEQKPEPSKITLTKEQLTAQKLKERIAGKKEAFKDQRSFQKQVSEAIKEVTTEGKIPSRKVQAIVRRAGKVMADKPSSVYDFVTYLDKVLADAEYDSKLEDSMRLRKRLSAKAKSSTIPVNQKQVLRKLVGIDPRKVSDITEYQDAAQKALDAVGVVRLAKKGGERQVIEKQRVTDQEIDAAANSLSAQQQQYEQTKAQEVEDEGAKLVSAIEQGPADGELEDIKKEYGLEGEQDSDDKAKLIWANRVEEKYKKNKSLIVDYITPKLEDLMEVNERLEKTFKDFDLNKLSVSYLAQLDMLLDNIAFNGSMANFSNIEIEVNAIKNAEAIIGMSFTPRKVYLWQTKMVSQILEKGTGDFDPVGTLGRLIGYTQKSLGFVKSNKKTAKAKEGYEALREQILKKNKVDILSVDSQSKMFLYSILSQPPGEVTSGGQEKVNAFMESVRGLMRKTVDAYNNSQDSKLKSAAVQMSPRIAELENITSPEQYVLDEPHQKAYQFWLDAHAEYKEELYNYLLESENRVLEDIPNYTAISYRNMDEATSVEIDPSPLQRLYAKMLVPKRSPNTITRNQSIFATYGDNKIVYNIFFAENQLQALKKNTNLIYTGDAIRLSSKVLNKQEVANKLGGKFVNSIKFAYNSELNAESLSAQAMVDVNWLAGTFVNLIRGQKRIGSRVVFGNPIFQTAKQSTVLSKAYTTAAQRKDGLYGLQEATRLMTNNRAEEILSLMPVSMRDAEKNLLRTTESIANMASFISTDRKRLAVGIETAKSNISRINKKIEDLQLGTTKSIVGLRGMDAFAARLTTLGAFLEYLSRNGVAIDTLTNEEIINRIESQDPLYIDAVGYADHITARDQGANTPVQMARISRPASVGEEFVRNILYAFSSFAITKGTTTITDVSKLTDRKSTPQQRKQAVSSLLGTAIESGAYSAMTIYGINTLWRYLAQLITGKEDDEIEEIMNDEFKAKRFMSETLMNSLPYVNSNPVSSFAVAAGINRAYYELFGKDENIFKDYEDYKKLGQDKIWIYQSQNNNLLENLGPYGIVFQQGAEASNYINAYSNGFYVDDYGNKVVIPEKDKEKYLISGAVMLIGALGLGLGETTKLARESAKEMKEDTFSSFFEGQVKGGGVDNKLVQEELDNLRKFYGIETLSEEYSKADDYIIDKILGGGEGMNRLKKRYPNPVDLGRRYGLLLKDIDFQEANKAVFDAAVYYIMNGMDQADAIKMVDSHILTSAKIRN